MHPKNVRVVAVRDGAGYLSVPGCPTNLDNSRTRACCAVLAVGVDGGYLAIFSLTYHFFSFSLSWTLLDID